MSEKTHLHTQGMTTRRSVLGDAHVDRAEAARTDFDSDFQDFITEGAWGSVWSRPGLTRRERSMITIALLAALGHDEEMAMHVRATVNTAPALTILGKHRCMLPSMPAYRRRTGLQDRQTRTWRSRGGVTMASEPFAGGNGGFYARDRAWHPPAASPAYKSTTLRAPRHALLSLGQTRSELTGPAFGHDIFNPLDNDLIRNFSQDGSDAIGQRLVVYGQILDENARPVNQYPGGVLASECGRPLSAQSRGRLYRGARPQFRRLRPGVDRRRRLLPLSAIRPGAYPWPNGGNNCRPAHIHFSVFGHAFAREWEKGGVKQPGQNLACFSRPSATAART